MSELRQSLRWQQLGMKRGIFFDFDSTLTTPIKVPRFHRHAVADRPDMFASMTGEEIEANFGGRPRIARLAEMLASLTDAGAELFIVSFGFRDSCIIPHLRAVGLFKFFSEDNIYGQDSEALRSRDFVKGHLIAMLMAERGWEPHDALFVDDTARHVEGAASVCEVLKVGGRGLSDAELEAISVICREGHAAASRTAICGAAVTPRKGATMWRLQPDDGVPPSAIVAGVWRVAEVPSERPRTVGGASPAAQPRRPSERSPPGSRQKLLDVSPMARRASEASPGVKRPLTTSPAARRPAEAATPCRRFGGSPPPARRAALDASPAQGRRGTDASPAARLTPARTPEASPRACARRAEAAALQRPAPRRGPHPQAEPAAMARG